MVVGGDHDFKEFEELCKQTTTAVNICVAEMKRMVTKALDMKSRDGFKEFTEDPNPLHYGANLLVDSGFFNKGTQETSLPGLKALVSMLTDISAVLRASPETITSLPEPDKFTFWEQMQSSMWIKDNLRPLIADDEWCNKSNAGLREVLSQIASDPNMLQALTKTLVEQLDEFRQYFGPALEGDLNSKGKITEVATMFFKHTEAFGWLSQDAAMEPDGKSWVLEYLSVLEMLVYLFGVNVVFESMCMCIYRVCVCVYVYVYVYVYVCMCVRACAYVFVCL